MTVFNLGPSAARQRKNNNNKNMINICFFSIDKFLLDASSRMGRAARLRLAVLTTLGRLQWSARGRQMGRGGGRG